MANLIQRVARASSKKLQPKGSSLPRPYVWCDVINEFVIESPIVKPITVVVAEKPYWNPYHQTLQNISRLSQQKRELHYSAGEWPRGQGTCICGTCYHCNQDQQPMILKKSILNFRSNLFRSNIFSVDSLQVRGLHTSAGLLGHSVGSSACNRLAATESFATGDDHNMHRVARSYRDLNANLMQQHQLNSVADYAESMAGTDKFCARDIQISSELCNQAASYMLLKQAPAAAPPSYPAHPESNTSGHALAASHSAVHGQFNRYVQPLPGWQKTSEAYWLTRYPSEGRQHMAAFGTAYYEIDRTD